MYQAAENRYDHMKYRRSGRSGVLLPEISLGLWQNFGLEKPLEEQREILLRAFDLGITHFDLANNYGAPARGKAEEILEPFWHPIWLPTETSCLFPPRPVMTAGPVLTVTGAPANT